MRAEVGQLGEDLEGVADEGVHVVAEGATVQLEAGARDGGVERGHVSHEHAQAHLQRREHNTLSSLDLTVGSAFADDWQVCGRSFRLR